MVISWKPSSAAFIRYLWNETEVRLRYFNDKVNEDDLSDPYGVRRSNYASQEHPSDQALLGNWERLQALLTKHQDSYENFLHWSKQNKRPPSQDLQEEVGHIMAKAIGFGRALSLVPLEAGYPEDTFERAELADDSLLVAMKQILVRPAPRLSVQSRL
jgi:hypothetical protein